MVDGSKDMIKMNYYSKLMIDHLLIWGVHHFNHKKEKKMVFLIVINKSILIFIIGIQYL